MCRKRETATIAAMYADFELESDGTVRPGRGGARPNAGRKPAGYEKPPETVEYERERTRNERAKADLNELEFKIKSREYIPRAAVQEAAATMLATLAQSLRSLPDTLERKFNLPPEVSERIEEEIDNQLDSISRDLEMLTNGEE